jgi:formylglycine-generating enzyme required for sulfatase activity
MKNLLIVAVMGLFLVFATAGSADVFNMGGMRNADGSWTGLASLETVPVGNPGNAADTRYGLPGYGAVAYTYNIGTYEVTNAQYAEFLNAVAAVGDPHGVYNVSMDSPVDGRDAGGISRSGSGTGGDPWVYSVRTNRGNRPVNYVSFWDACRFANWLHNGQPTGSQDLTTTENGAYFLNGVTNPNNESISRETGAKVWIPSEDEWYKAAYYKSGGTNSGYWDYPTASDTAPKAESPPGTDMKGSANWNFADTTHYPTSVGAYTYKPSDSAYGTFDQGGNLWEWNEAIVSTSSRGTRGGSFSNGNGEEIKLKASHRNDYPPTYEHDSFGFRVAMVPQPSTISGHVVDSHGNGISDVLMTGFPDPPVVTQADGSYSATVEYGWSGTVTPTKEGYSFVPASRTYNNITLDMPGEYYMGSILTYRISGRVLWFDDSPHSGVLIWADNGGPLDITDATGYYELTISYGWSGTVRADLNPGDNWGFVPPNRSYDNVTVDQSDNDFESRLLGDTDHDGDVDLVDLGNLATYYGTTSGAIWAMGDFDGDGDVDLVDLGNMATNYGYGVPAAPLDFTADAEKLGLSNAKDATADESSEESKTENLLPVPGGCIPTAIVLMMCLAGAFTWLGSYSGRKS